MRNTRQDKNIQAMIDASVSAVYARANNQAAILSNHTDIQQPAASTVAITGTSGAPTGIIQGGVVPKVTGKFRVRFSAVVTPSNTSAHKVTVILGFSQNTGTGAIFPFATANQILTMNPVGMPLTTAGVLGGAALAWTVETTAIGNLAARSIAFGVSMFGDDTTSLSVNGGGAQLTVEEIF